MPIDVIVGGQGGDEGKGKIVEWLSMNNDYSIFTRVSAPQAGHSVYYNGKRVGLALLPCGFVNPDARLLLGAGSLISVNKLQKELEMTDLDEKRLGIDYRATIVTEEYLREERENSHLMNSIGSVGTGVGPCRRDKIMRNEKLLFAKDIPELQKYLTDTKKEIFSALENKKEILLEGDHGAKLDLIHGEYPFVTSRSVNASSVLGELGIGPREIRDIHVILKPYTTRVGPGPLEEEIFNEDALEWAHNEGGETGTVSKRLRRIGKFEWEKVSEVVKMNSTSLISITHMDIPQFFWEALGFSGEEEFLENVNEKICNKYPYPKISLLSYGPTIEDIIKK
ncbi:MAG: adenylosuccinate synthetase [Candidatus Pacearchaeota archaeon]